MENKLEQKYAAKNNDFTIQQQEKEAEYQIKLKKLEEREEAMKNQSFSLKVDRSRDINALNKKIKTMHELVKTVMCLHQNEVSWFEKQRSQKPTNAKSFSFDMSKAVKDIEEDSQLFEVADNDRKDKIIIEEPLDVFELDNDSHNQESRSSSFGKNSRKASDSKTDENNILLNYSNPFDNRQSDSVILKTGAEGSIEQSDSKIENSDEKDDDEQSTSVHKNIDFLDDFVDERWSDDSKSENEDKEKPVLDYREQLRKSLQNGTSKKLEKTEKQISEHEKKSEGNLLSPTRSEHSNEDIDPAQKSEYLMSPLNENYDDFDEFRNNFKKKQQEMLEEFNSMNKKQFELVQKFTHKFEDGAVNEKPSDSEDNDTNDIPATILSPQSQKEITFSPKVSDFQAKVFRRKTIIQK